MLRIDIAKNIMRDVSKSVKPKAALLITKRNPSTEVASWTGVNGLVNFGPSSK